jgi:hypothetical protein
MSPVSDPSVECVIWEDTTNVGGWLDRSEIESFATDGGWMCRNVGWLTYEDADCIVLSARRSDDDQQHVGLSERIPKRSIIGRRALTDQEAQRP